MKACAAPIDPSCDCATSAMMKQRSPAPTCRSPILMVLVIRNATAVRVTQRPPGEDANEASVKCGLRRDHNVRVENDAHLAPEHVEQDRDAILITHAFEHAD